MFVKREAGKIVGSARWPHPVMGIIEELPDDDLELLEFSNPTVPRVITATQAKKALHRKDSSLNGTIRSIVNRPGNEEAAIDWDNSTQFHRDSPFIAALAAEVPLSETEIDDLFIAGSQI